MQFTSLLKILFLSCIVLPVMANDNDRWWNADECCECVPFYACENNTIVPDRLRENDRRKAAVNINMCSNPLIEFCCLKPDLSDECKSFPIDHMPPPIDKTPRPDVQCECALWETCALDHVVTDGKGDSTSFLHDIGLATHSKCKDSLDVCCDSRNVNSESRPIPSNVPVTRLMMRMNDCRCVSPKQCSKTSTDGENVIEPRVGSGGNNDNNNFTNHTCPNEEEICCKLNYIIGDDDDESSGVAGNTKHLWGIFIPLMAHVFIVGNLKLN